MRVWMINSLIYWHLDNSVSHNCTSWFPHGPVQSQDQGLFLWCNWSIRQNKSRACCSACASSIMHKRCTGRKLLVKHDTCKSAPSPFSTRTARGHYTAAAVSEPVRLLTCIPTWCRRDAAVRWSKRSRLIDCDQLPPVFCASPFRIELLTSNAILTSKTSAWELLILALSEDKHTHMRRQIDHGQFLKSALSLSSAPVNAELWKKSGNKLLRLMLIGSTGGVRLFTAAEAPSWTFMLPNQVYLWTNHILKAWVCVCSQPYLELQPTFQNKKMWEIVHFKWVGDN